MVHGIGGLVLALFAALPAAPARLVESESFTTPLPDGYSDITELIRSRGFPRRQVTLQANAMTKGYQPTEGGRFRRRAKGAARDLYEDVGPDEGHAGAVRRL